MRIQRRKRNKNIIKFSLVLLLLISIGYASLSTTLTINGITNISQMSWLVYFTNVRPNANNDVAQVVTVPSTTGKTTTTLNWAVNMDMPGQMYEFTVDVVNEGTIDAMIETETNNLISQGLTASQKEYLDYTVTYINGALVEKNDKLAAGETKTLKIKLEFKPDIELEDLSIEEETVAITYSINYVQADDNAIVKRTSMLGIGDTVNYSTTLNGVTLDNWKVFYVDGDYTYIILDDYLPNSAIDTSKSYFNKLSKNGDYSIYVDLNESGTVLELRTYLIDALSTKSNWDSLLTGTINGHTVNETRSEYVFAMGSPNIELWKNSWNTAYLEDTIYTKYADDLVIDNITYDGWYIGMNENSSAYDVDLSEKEGYNNNLYYPHKAGIDSNKCCGYWLASPCARGYHYCIGVNCYGCVYSDFFADKLLAFRPVVSLPTSVVNQ